MPKKIARALISVSDKSNLQEIVSYLEKNNVEIISTGGTYKAISKISENVIEISDYTGCPEMLGGRVKTLNPKIHGGVLASRSEESHLADMAANDIKPIDLVIVNLYPFEEVVERGAEFSEAIENIDVGGPTMIRAAAKNHKDVVVVTDPSDYSVLIAEMEGNDNATSGEFRKEMAIKAFARTATYDTAIHEWFAVEQEENLGNLQINAKVKQQLRYGENPHQAATLFQVSDNGIVGAKQIQGKELSYNNINDADAAYELINEFKEPAAAIIKHANPCGVATGANICEAYQKALAGDPISSFGGIIALNGELDAETATIIKKTFFEVIITPTISNEAREILSSKKNMRILIKGESSDVKQQKILSVSGGILVQDIDDKIVTKADLTFVTKRKPTEAELSSMLFGFKLVKHVKSNAIIYVDDNRSVGIGAGQMSRVDSVRVATMKFNDFKQEKQFEPKGLVVASDAFFPFADGLILAAEAGVTAAIQPGGSIRDEEVIQAADERNIAMAFTGVRHFRH
jgi:phosphoribosylaminoimidazolecarboxamide formyltransferase/IMP cyclohydrolase